MPEFAVFGYNTAELFEIMSKHILNLCGLWQLRESDEFANDAKYAVGEEDWRDVSVPNSIYCNLAEIGNYEMQELDVNPELYGWVANANWVYKKNFDCSKELLSKEKVELFFEGLDTITKIWLNGELVGETENMFISHRFDVKSLLKPENNELVVAFEPVREYAQRKMDEHPIDGIRTKRSYVRKGQYVYSWDWCPALEGCGIWRGVSLEGVDFARIESVYACATQIGDDWADVKIEVELDKVLDANYVCQYKLGNDEVCGEFEIAKGKSKATLQLRVENPRLWWPVGYGEANLYELEITLVQNAAVADVKCERFGIRIVELDTSEDEHGNKYQFVINGKPIYLKGANWVPATMFPGSLREDDYRELLEGAVEVNMNILRVWGGGYYEDKAFYDICDELGLMVWQEFMFACAYYPDQSWYHKMIRVESAHVLKSLRNHPCKIIWCGNNECDWIHYEFWSKDTPVFHGEKIYHELLPAQVGEIEPNAIYVPSSPIATREGVNPNEPHSGDAHDWDVWNFQKPITEFLVAENKITRLASEFGMHGSPDVETIRQFCPEKQQRIGSKCFDKHNYQEDNSRIYRYIGELFAMPRNLEEFSYLSQLMQARAIGMYSEYLRAHNHRNHGIMFWQYNDAAPCISWSAVDYYNRPKALMYYSRRFFADVLVTAVPHVVELFNPDFIGNVREPLKLKKIVAINDTSEKIEAELVCTIIELNGEAIDELVRKVEIPAHSKFELNDLPEIFARPDDAAQNVLVMELVNDGEVIAENTFLYVPDKHIDWPEPKITKELVDQDDELVLKLSCDVFVKDLQISAGSDVRVSENYFDMFPDAEYVVAIENINGDIIDVDKIALRSVQTSW